MRFVSDSQRRAVMATLLGHPRVLAAAGGFAAGAATYGTMRAIGARMARGAVRDMMRTSTTPHKVIRAMHHIRPETKTVLISKGAPESQAFSASTNDPATWVTRVGARFGMALSRDRAQAIRYGLATYRRMRAGGLYNRRLFSKAGGVLINIPRIGYKNADQTYTTAMYNSPFVFAHELGHQAGHPLVKRFMNAIPVRISPMAIVEEARANFHATRAMRRAGGSAKEILGGIRMNIGFYMRRPHLAGQVALGAGALTHHLLKRSL